MDNDNKSTQTGNRILVLVAMVLGVLIGLMFSHSGGRRHGMTRPSALQSKMEEVLRLVEKEYVDDVDVDSLSEHLVAVMLSELDPHSTYLSVRETERTDEMMRGNFEGVGLVLHREGDTTYVGQVMADGPSAGSGILPGDMILTVDGDTVSGVGMPADSVVARLRGPRRSTVDITVKRQNSPHNPQCSTLNYSIRRGVVDYATLPCSLMLDDTTGYILITSFSQTTHKEFRTALTQLKKKGLRHLILDLRGNGGGSLGSAVGVAGELLPQGSLIVYTQGTHSRRNNVHSQGIGLFTKGKVTVLVDETSASASEVVAGALQDNDHATIMGRRTFGKGLVQTEFTLNDGSSVLLTTARYYTPSGRCIQRPYDDGTDEYYRSYMQQLIDETYADTATTTATDTTPYHTVGGRVVYGGGGITPDIILPYLKDSSFIYYNRLSSAGILNRVAFGYVKGHAAELKTRYANPDDFYRHFKVSEALVQEVTARGVQKGIALDPRSLKTQRKLITNMIKAYIGQSLFGDSMFYRVYIDEDNDLRELKTKN